MAKILCSTGALIGKPNNMDYRLLKKLKSELTCDGFEFMMYSSWYEKKNEIIDSLLEMELYIPVMHCEKHIGQAISIGTSEDINEAIHLFESNCDIAKKLNVQKLVLHLWDGLISDQNFQNNLKAYKSLAEIAASYNVDLLVENVVCNLENPMKHWCELAKEYPGIHFIFDTKMAAFHEQLNLLYEDKYSWLFEDNHIHHYHVNDYAGGYMDWANLRALPLGQGHIDFNEFFRFVTKTGYNGTYTVEATAFNEEGTVDTQMLNRCFEQIRESLSNGSLEL